MELPDEIRSTFRWQRTLLELPRFDSFLASALVRLLLLSRAVVNLYGLFGLLRWLLIFRHDNWRHSLDALLSATELSIKAAHYYWRIAKMNFASVCEFCFFHCRGVLSDNVLDLFGKTSAMDERFIRKPAAVAMLLSCGWGQACLGQDSKFIVQPSKQPAAVVEPQISLEPTTTAVSQPTSQLSAELKTAVAPMPATPVPAPPMPVAPSVAEPKLELTLPEVQERDPEVASPTGSPQPVEPVRGNGLKWVSRSAVGGGPRTLSSREVGPLEITNPNYTEPQRKIAATPATIVTPRQAEVETPQPSPPSVPSAPKAVLASLVSSQISAGRPSTNMVAGREVESLAPPPGWQAVGQELSQRLARCEALINRKAFFSAREDAEAAMLYLVRVLDLMSNSYSSEPAWFAAQRALIEADDFSTAQRLTSDSAFLRRIILSHETPVLKDADVDSLAPMAAAQHYRKYAESKLVEASQGHPWASDVIYALGRSYQSQSETAADGTAMPLRWRAITMYQSARQIAPNNAVAANQLGFVLLQMDRPAEAREALIASLHSAMSVSALENMIEASRRLNDVAMSNWAMQQYTQLKSSIPASANIPNVLEVDVRTFAAISPYSVGPNAQAPGSSAGQAVLTGATALPMNY